MARRVSAGPSVPGGNRVASASAVSTGTATRPTTTAEPRSLAPNMIRTSSMKLAPRNAATEPAAVATAFIVTTSARGTTSGSAADRPEATNRANPLASSAPHSSGMSGAPTTNSTATTTTSSSRPALAHTNTQRRSQRSNRAPANGPSNE